MSRPYAVFVECPECGGRIDLRVESVVRLQENDCNGCGRWWRIHWTRKGAFRKISLLTGPGVNAGVPA